MTAPEILAVPLIVARIRPYRTNKELLSHCQEGHKDSLGNTHTDISYFILLTLRKERVQFFFDDRVSGMEGKGRRGYWYLLCENTTDIL